MRSRQLLESSRHAGAARLRHEPDACLVDMVRAGNERAFEEIVRRYRAPLLRQSSRILQPERADEAVQETFVKADRAIRDGDAELELRPWLHRIARNTSLNLLRQVRFGDQELDETIDGVERPDEAFERRDRMRRLVGSIQRLPPRQRDALVLHELEGRSYREIAGRLEVSDGAVRQLLSRGRERLRSGLAAVTPAGLLGRLASGPRTAGSLPDGAGVAGAGGAGVVAKVAAAVLASGAVIAGGVSLPTHTHPSRAARPHPSPSPLSGTVVGPGSRLPGDSLQAGAPPREGRARLAPSGTASTARLADPASDDLSSVSGRDRPGGDDGSSRATGGESGSGVDSRGGGGPSPVSNERGAGGQSGESSRGGDSTHDVNPTTSVQAGSTGGGPGPRAPSGSDGGGPGPSAPSASDGGGTGSGTSGSDGGLVSSRQDQSESPSSSGGH